MTNLLIDLQKRGLITPPSWLPHNLHWLVIMGSIAYAANEGYSDFDTYGWAIPPKDILFPGYIPVLIIGDLDLRRNSEQLKSIRRGDFTEEQIIEIFKREEKLLEELYTTSTLPAKPKKGEIRELLLNCLEQHYGSLDNVERPDKYRNAAVQIRDMLNEVGL